MAMKGLISHVIDGFGRCCHVCSSSVNGVEDAHKNKDRGCDITSAARFAKSAKISAGISMRVSKAGTYLHNHIMFHMSAENSKSGMVR